MHLTNRKTLSLFWSLFRTFLSKWIYMVKVPVLNFLLNKRVKLKNLLLLLVGPRQQLCTLEFGSRIWDIFRRFRLPCCWWRRRRSILTRSFEWLSCRSSRSCRCSGNLRNDLQSIFLKCVDLRDNLQSIFLKCVGLKMWTFCCWCCYRDLESLGHISDWNRHLWSFFHWKDWNWSQLRKNKKRKNELK